MTKEWEEAVHRGDLRKVTALINAGVDINKKDQFAQTGLMLAARNGHLEVVRLLVKHGADLDTTATYNLSALMLAVVNGRTEIALTLLEAGADLGIRGSGAPGFYGKTASDLAAYRGQNELAQRLREPRASASGPTGTQT